MAHSCVDYCLTPTPGLGSIVVELSVILVLKGTRKSRIAARETSYMNLHVLYAILTRRKDPGRVMMTRRRP